MVIIRSITITVIIELTDGAAAGVGGGVCSRIAHTCAETTALVQPPAHFTGRAICITVMVRQTTGSARRHTVHRRTERVRPN